MEFLKEISELIAGFEMNPVLNLLHGILAYHGYSQRTIQVVQWLALAVLVGSKILTIYLPL